MSRQAGKAAGKVLVIEHSYGQCEAHSREKVKLSRCLLSLSLSRLAFYSSLFAV